MGTPTIDLRGMAARIRVAREARDLTIIQLAEECEVTPSAVRYWEDAHGPPRGDALYRLALVLGVTSDHLLGIDRLRGAS